MSDRICFLAGAGLSYDADLPTSVALAKKLQEHLESAVRDDADSQAAEFRAAFNFLVGGIRFQEGILDRDPNASINIEQIATAAIRLASRATNPLSPYVSGWHQRLVQIEAGRPSILENFVKLMFTKLEEWLTPLPNADLAYLCNLKDFLDLSPTLDVFTLNYDLCVESALTDLAQTKFRNGFTEDGWRPETLEADGGIRLFKLHGSLDWVNDEEFGIASIEFPAHRETDALVGRKPPLLIFGTDQKVTGLDPFLTLLYHLSSSLDTASVLVIIGYSFGDDYINQVVLQRMQTNPGMKLVVVAPTAKNIVASIPWLNNSARVFTLDEGAKSALNRRTLRQLVRSKLQEMRDDNPFGDSSEGEMSQSSEAVMPPIENPPRRMSARERKRLKSTDGTKHDS